MGLFLIATAGSWSVLAVLQWILVIIEVLVALGLVIFVHELGHFAVAKLCGVKVDKFYLGFDIYGLKLARFRWGETEYGIGVLPLGGYVKMLGQEDNPARLREEIERAKAKPQAAGDTAAQPEEEIDVAAAEQALYDPRSYLAQSVPNRMAIISAGVVMNMIFAFLMGAIAYWIGVQQLACGVGGVIPGEGAWRAGLRVGDRIVEIGDKPVKRFQELKAIVSLGNIDQGVSMVVERPGVPEPKTFVIKPDRIRDLPSIGVAPPLTTTLNEEGPAVRPESAAAKADPAFQAGDRVVAVNGTPVDDYAHLHSYFALHPAERLKITVERAAPKQSGQAPAAMPKRVNAEVPPQPMQDLGLVMEMGEIAAIQAESPAAAAGFQIGDRINRFDGQAVGDPMTLPDRLRDRAGQRVTFSIGREGAKEPIDIAVVLRPADRFDPPGIKGSPLAVPSLGLAYRVLNRVRKVNPGSPGARAGLQAGDLIVHATITAPPKGEQPEGLLQRDKSLDFSEKERSWPVFIEIIQETLPGTRFELQWRRGEEIQSATVEPSPVRDWFNPNRGFLFQADFFDQQASSVSEALKLGGQDTVESTLLVYRFLQKLGTGQVPMTGVGGPVTIFRVAFHAAEEGLSPLLMFLMLISANLAVINFLPIPVLDGGHMVFLIWEGIRGKPADERVQLVLTYIGLIFILGLMIWVLGLDIHSLIGH